MITLAQFSVLTLYLIIIYKRFGILESISHSSYEWLGNERYWFLVMCWVLGFLNLAQGMGGWGFWTSAGLFATGITVKWMESGSVEFYLHSIGAVTAVLVGFIGLWVVHGIWIPFAIFAVIASITWNALPNRIWWIEVQAFLLILIGYMLR